MRRALVLSALSVTAAALMARAAHLEIDTAISAQLAFAAFLFLAAWFGHWIKSRKEG